MSIPGQQTINIGLPNESANSESLYSAFNKVQNNFTSLFSCASPFNTFTAGTGISTNANATSGTVTITNSGVTGLTAGTNIVLSGNTGNITISSTGSGGGSGTVTSIGVLPTSNTRIVTTGGPIVGSGNIYVDLANSGATAGSYNNPNVNVDIYGRITSISNGVIAGSVTSVGLTPGPGVQINGGPITTNGNITVTNTGVLRINPGAGISLSSGNGNVTISTTSLGGTVTSVGVSSSTLAITSSPVVQAGVINIELPNNVTFSGNVTSGNLSANGRIILSGAENLTNGSAANLQVDASYFSTSGASTATLAAGTAGQRKTFAMVADGGDMVITVTNAGWKSSGTGTITFTAIGQACILQYINTKWFVVGNNGPTFA
jgi:fibronectin-binding autotransporter adhesin